MWKAWSMLSLTGKKGVRSNGHTGPHLATAANVVPEGQEGIRIDL